MDNGAFEKNVELITRLVIEALAQQGEGCGAKAAPPAPAAGERRLISEGDVLALKAQGETTLRCSRRDMVTALAADRLKQEGMRLEYTEE